MWDFEWSASDKEALAREAFDRALNDELQQLVCEAKARVGASPRCD